MKKYSAGATILHLLFTLRCLAMPVYGCRA